MVFRRLYMKGDLAHTQKAAEVFCRLAAGHWTARWVESMLRRFDDRLGKPPECLPFSANVPLTFTTKRLLDAFIYTRFAHQPDARRARHYEACLAEVHGEKEMLAWMFLSALFECSLDIRNIGVEIARFFHHHVEQNARTLEGLSPLDQEHSGIGTLESKLHRYHRLRSCAVSRLAHELAQQHGLSGSDAEQFLSQAGRELDKCIPPNLIHRDGVERRPSTPPR